MTVINPADFSLEVPRGRVEGFSNDIKFGFNLDVSAATPEDLIEQGGQIVFPDVAEALEVVSDAAADTGIGTGANIVKIIGLDTNFLEFEENVIMNGLTPVPLVAAFRRTGRMIVLTSGTANEITCKFWL